MTSYRTRREFDSLLHGEETLRRTRLEHHIAWTHRGQESFSVPGFCVVCDEPVELLVDLGCHDPSSPAWLPNWRERLLCPGCGLNNRQRLVAGHVMSRLRRRLERGAGVAVYLMEQVTPIYRVLRERFPQVDVVGSEYLGLGREPGSVDGVRHEDVQNLSFPDASFDLVVSNDVMEHVPDPWVAFRETGRVLRPDGLLVMTVPFFSASDTSVTRAVLEGGIVRHALPPVYHGNPLSNEGSLVFTDFGWDLLVQLRNEGFDDPRMEIGWSLELGHLGGLPSVFLASKASRPA